MDAVPLESKSPVVTAEGFETLLSRAPKPDTVLTDLGTEWGGAFAKLLDEKGIDHSDKPPADHGSFALIDTGIKTLKQTIAVLRRTKDMNLQEAVEKALREYNADINETTGTAPKTSRATRRQLFSIYQQQAQNLVQNLRENEKLRQKIEGREGLRPLIMGTDEDGRRSALKSELTIRAGASSCAWPRARTSSNSDGSSRQTGSRCQ